jgi:hypothetical protein
MIANNISTPQDTQIPQHWPDDRFDVVWSFTREVRSGTYTFDQIPELLLAGDIDERISP